MFTTSVAVNPLRSLAIIPFAPPGPAMIPLEQRQACWRAGQMDGSAIWNPMPIPNAIEATAATEKVRDYLLNPEHPDGGSKAAWLQSLGYACGRWHELASDLLKLAATCELFATVRTPFGVKYVVKGQIRRKCHRSANVLAVWIIEADRPPRLVTAYPDEEP